MLPVNSPWASRCSTCPDKKQYGVRPVDDEQPLTRDKPAELVALRAPLASAFDILKQAVGVGDTHTFRLDDINCGGKDLIDRYEVAAFTLRKLQARYYVATPGVLTRNTVVMFLAADLNLSLTEMADYARSLNRDDAFKQIIECRNAINRVSMLVASLSKSHPVDLT